MNYYLYINYIVYATNYSSGNSHGRTAIIIKENIKHYLLVKYETEKIQATWLKYRISEPKQQYLLRAAHLGTSFLVMITGHFLSFLETSLSAAVVGMPNIFTTRTSTLRSYK